MKKIAKKNLKLDKEVIASLSENEMSKVTGEGYKTNELICNSLNRPCPEPIFSRDNKLECQPIDPVPFTKFPCGIFTSDQSVDCGPVELISMEGGCYDYTNFCQSQDKLTCE